MQNQHCLHRKELPGWKPLKVGLGITMLWGSLPAALSAASSVAGYTIQQAEQPMTMTVRLDQWNTLKKEVIAQENDLSQLKQKLQMLKSTSSEQMQLLENLQSELNKTRQNLMNANASLIECQRDLQESRQSLEMLKQQIKAMEHKQVVMRRQRDAYAFGFALSVASLLK